MFILCFLIWKYIPKRGEWVKSYQSCLFRINDFFGREPIKRGPQFDVTKWSQLKSFKQSLRPSTQKFSATGFKKGGCEGWRELGEGLIGGGRRWRGGGWGLKRNYASEKSSSSPFSTHPFRQSDPTFLFRPGISTLHTLCAEKAPVSSLSPEQFHSSPSHPLPYEPSPKPPLTNENNKLPAESVFLLPASYTLFLSS